MKKIIAVVFACSTIGLTASVGDGLSLIGEGVKNIGQGTLQVITSPFRGSKKVEENKKAEQKRNPEKKSRKQR